jgi:hypothetical protein
MRQHAAGRGHAVFLKKPRTGMVIRDYTLRAMATPVAGPTVVCVNVEGNGRIVSGTTVAPHATAVAVRGRAQKFTDEWLCRPRGPFRLCWNCSIGG